MVNQSVLGIWLISTIMLLWVDLISTTKGQALESLSDEYSSLIKKWDVEIEDKSGSTAITPDL